MQVVGPASAPTCASSSSVVSLLCQQEEHTIGCSKRPNVGHPWACADACLQVSLLNYPSVVQHAPALRYPGHSSHVTGVRWARDESYAVSVGGRDRYVTFLLNLYLLAYCLRYSLAVPIHESSTFLTIALRLQICCAGAFFSGVYCLTSSPSTQCTTGSLGRR